MIPSQTSTRFSRSLGVSRSGHECGDRWLASHAREKRVLYRDAVVSVIVIHHQLRFLISLDSGPLALVPRTIVRPNHIPGCDG